MSAEPRSGRLDGFGRVLLNGMSGAGARIAMMLVGFALTPFILASLGFVDFGLVAIFGTLAGYLGLLDFGLGGTFVKFITDYTEKGDLASVRQVVTFGTLFYLGLGIAMEVPVFVCSPFIVHFFKMPAADFPRAVLVFREFFGVVVASMVLSVPGTAVVAKHRMDLASRNNFAGYLVYAVVTVVLLRLGYGITGIVLAQGAQLIVTATLHYLTASRWFGSLFADPRRLDGSIVKRMFKFGGWTQLTTILNIVIIDTGRFLSASLVGVASVTYYEVGGKLAFISRTLPNYLVDAVAPAAAAAAAHQDHQALRKIELTGSLYLLLVTTLIAGFVVGACDPIMRVWLGTRYPYVALITLWLSIGYVVSSFGTIGVTMLRSIGRPDLEAACVGVGAVVNVAATLEFIRLYGIVGAAMGACVGTAAFGLSYAVIQRKREALSEDGGGIMAASRIVFVGVCCAGSLAWLVQLKWVDGLFVSKVPGLIALSACGACYVSMFAALSWLVGALRFDQERIVTNMRALLRGRTATTEVR